MARGDFNDEDFRREGGLIRRIFSEGNLAARVLVWRVFGEEAFWQEQFRQRGFSARADFGVG